MPTLGCIRVMNTSYTPTPFGNSVSGLECGTAVISAEATARYKQYHPDSDAWVAVTNHHVVKNSSHVMCNFYFNLIISKTYFLSYSSTYLSTSSSSFGK